MRKWLISIHLSLAAFLAPMLLLVGVSGGLYLLGIKGAVSRSPVEIAVGSTLDLSSSTLEADVRRVLQESGVEHEFEYIKKSDSVLFTRPTSRLHYELSVTNDSLKVTRNEPDLQKALVELHKGHGPLLFKDFQKVMAVGLLFIVLSGLWLGLSSERMRSRTAAILALGLGTCAVLGFVI